MEGDEKTNRDSHPPYERAHIGAKDAAGADYLKKDGEPDNGDASSEHLERQLTRLETKDDKLKKWVRVLKFTSRTLGVILSFATIILLAAMTRQFLATRNSYYNVNGNMRTPWPVGVEMVYNNVYLTFSVITFMLDIVILLAYFKGIQQANKVAQVAAIWSSVILGIHIVFMVIAIAVYGGGAGSKGADDVNRDLWGWTCSSDAQKLQPYKKDMQYKKWCDVQNMAFYIGIANASATTLTLTIYGFAIARKRSKKEIYYAPRRQAYDGAEPVNNVSWIPLDRKQSNSRQLCSWSSLDGKEPVAKECSWAPIDGRLDGNLDSDA